MTDRDLKQEPDLIHLGKKLKHVRERLFLRQEDVAESLSISVRTYSKWEQGESFPGSVLMLIRVSRYLQISLDWWLIQEGQSCNEQEKFFDSKSLNLFQNLDNNKKLLMHQLMEILSNPSHTTD